MDLFLDRLLISSPEAAIDFFKTNEYKYKLIEIKPPYKNKDNLKKQGRKRVLKIKRKDDFFEITWSFQYNS